MPGRVNANFGRSHRHRARGDRQRADRGSNRCELSLPREKYFRESFQLLAASPRRYARPRPLRLNCKVPSRPRSVACEVVLSFRRMVFIRRKTLRIDPYNSGAGRLTTLDRTSESWHSKRAYGTAIQQFRAPARSNSNHWRLGDARRKVREPPTAATNFFHPPRDTCALSPCARRRRNAVHASMHHPLAVMIVAMQTEKRRRGEPRGLAGTERRPCARTPPRL